MLGLKSEHGLEAAPHAADQVGMAASHLLDRSRLAQAAADFAGSAEFAARHGASPDAGRVKVAADLTLLQGESLYRAPTGESVK